jgi:hypothetical protein
VRHSGGRNKRVIDEAYFGCCKASMLVHGFVIFYLPPVWSGAVLTALLTVSKRAQFRMVYHDAVHF